ncbi:TIGR00730 family Rossman fold protein [Methyloceanibacter caenitepidi]|uniref:Cytokinin riboside 5'-monophosphate phosphoribohydrolase n=1 Tax=Methyloceanibacter caenitepidi TaxID=1384459 RepID=A0A0A8K4V0_9HYPH|nr:TIGR00730 family Rossman fold protein [Methyloceanibacter caenitepidi]BAQ17900.1 lysine decarboxylase family [Methyloceanibacter caenitepidi]
MTRDRSKVETVCVYCGSGAGHNPAFTDAARALGEALAEAGTNLVYGGGDLGLMGIVARSVIDSGGHVTGIMPEFLHDRERMLVDVHELVIVDTMHERKHLMYEKSDAFVALPGGIGTLEEFVEQLTWSQLGQHKKPIVLVNIHGFWDPLLELFDRMMEHNFIRSGFELKMCVADSAEDVLPVIHRLLAELEEEPKPKYRVVEKL